MRTMTQDAKLFHQQHITLGSTRASSVSVRYWAVSFSKRISFDATIKRVFDTLKNEKQATKEKQGYERRDKGKSRLYNVFLTVLFSNFYWNEFAFVSPCCLAPCSRRISDKTNTESEAIDAIETKIVLLALEAH
mmetsp:Transcript_27924/g.76856  ORF Transcript_27924/g.76856 Transcript_27924/m.76856 type:complete len:134 (-) Transcript_27924:232-633(-)